MFKTMNSSYLREIPLRILNRKIGDEHVTLLQACYDNPIFHEEDGKGIPQQNGTEKPGIPAEVCNSVEGRGRTISGHMASDYMHSLPATSPSQRTPSNDVTYRGYRKRKWRCIVYAACAFFLLLIGIGLLVYLLEGDESSDTKTSSVIFLARVEVNLTLRSGPFSAYQYDYLLKQSVASRLLRRAFVYQISDVFSSSDLSSIYNSTEIKRVRNVNGSVSLNFIIWPPPHVTSPANNEARIAAILIEGLKNTLFVVDSKSISVKLFGKAVPEKPSKPWAGKIRQCLSFTIKECINTTSYSSWTTPNVLGHRSEQEVNAYLMKHQYLVNSLCFNIYTHFFCSAFFPDCPASGTKSLLPCRDYCWDVMATCQPMLTKLNITVPFKCEAFLDSDDSSACITRPYTPGKCVPVVNKACNPLGFNSTAFPNALGHVSLSREELTMIDFYDKLQSATGCFKHSVFFACSLIVPSCSGKDPPNHYIPPCRSLCQKYRDQCKIFIDVFNTPWPENLNCSKLPDSPDPTVCAGYREAHEPHVTVCPKPYIQCGDKKTCIEKKWLCDEVQDCPDNSDEVHCAMCGQDEDRCSSSSSLCIGKSQGCDGIVDCYGETDETYCVRLDPSSEEDVLQVRNPVSSRWEEVCKDGWTQDLSDLTCKQLGYRKNLATYYTPKNSSFQSVITTLNNGSDPDRLQSYLLKGQTSCPSGYVVKLLCWKAACGSRPAYVGAAIRVRGGEEVRPGTWPWMVSLHGGSGESFFCGATIIEADWVLTASHCVGWADRTTSYWTIKTGNNRKDVYSEYRQVRKPKRLFRHPMFKFETVESDIALIQLDKPFKFNDYVRAICLPDAGTVPGTRCLVTGWGKSGFTALKYQRALRQVAVDVTTWNYCYNALMNSETASPYTLKKNMFCAGGTIAHDGCQGDSGGPLVCKKPNTTDEWYQSGVVSWGIKCGLPYVPAVYTNLTQFNDWIHDTIANNSNTNALTQS